MNERYGMTELKVWLKWMDVDDDDDGGDDDDDDGVEARKLTGDEGMIKRRCSEWEWSDDAAMIIVEMPKKRMTMGGTKTCQIQQIVKKQGTNGGQQCSEEKMTRVNNTSTESVFEESNCSTSRPATTSYTRFSLPYLTLSVVSIWNFRPTCSVLLVVGIKMTMVVHIDGFKPFSFVFSCDLHCPTVPWLRISNHCCSAAITVCSINARNCDQIQKTDCFNFTGCLKQCFTLKLGNFQSQRGWGFNDCCVICAMAKPNHRFQTDVVDTLHRWRCAMAIEARCHKLSRSHDVFLRPHCSQEKCGAICIKKWCHFVATCGEKALGTCFPSNDRMFHMEKQRLP